MKRGTVTDDVFDVSRGDDGVAIITMNRPAKLNAMGPAFFRQLPQVLAELDQRAAGKPGLG